MADTPDAAASARAAEEFLRSFHDREPGRQSAGAGACLTVEGRTTYEEFADRLTGARRVLDLGCADGALLEVLAERGAEALAGVDLSEEELAVARRRSALAHADLRRGRAQELPFPAGSFDTVVSHMAFMLMWEVEQVVAEVARVLVPGGVFAAASGGGAVEGQAQELFLELAKPFFRVAADEGRGMPRFGDRRARTRDGLDGILAPAGFSPVTWESIVIDQSGTPEQVWEASFATFYNVVVLEDDQVAALRSGFLAEAASLAVDGRVPSTMRIDFATARLVGRRDAPGDDPIAGGCAG
jgi:SAM-dependent methyltransferase